MKFCHWSMLAHTDGYGLLSIILIFNFQLLLPHCCDNISQISNIVQCHLWDMSPTQPGASWLKATNFASLGNSSRHRDHAAPPQQDCLLLAEPCEKSSPEYGCASPALLCHGISNTVSWPLVTLQVCSCPIASAQECLPSHVPKHGSQKTRTSAEEETELAVTTELSHSSVQEDDGHDNRGVCSTVIYSNLDTSQLFPCC